MLWKQTDVERLMKLHAHSVDNVQVHIKTGCFLTKNDDGDG